MEKEIQEFISYLHEVKKTSNNTEISYQRDLLKMARFMYGPVSYTHLDVYKRQL